MNREEAMSVVEAVQAQINEETEIVLGGVDALMMKRYATAVGDVNPIYVDREAAQKAGYPDIIAHPNFLTAILVWESGPQEHLLRMDGTVLDGFVPSKGFRRMGGGQHLKLVSPVIPGDQIRMKRKLISAEMKEANSGLLVLIGTEKTYLNQDDQIRVICRETLIVR